MRREATKIIWTQHQEMACKKNIDQELVMLKFWKKKKGITKLGPNKNNRHPRCVVFQLRYPLIITQQIKKVNN